MVSISAIEVRHGDADVVVSASITMPGREGTAWYRLPADVTTDSDCAADAFFIVGMILAMGSDGVLMMDQPVSKRLIYNSRAAQDILLNWYPTRLRRIEVMDISERGADQAAIYDRTVTCFTGGVDSFDTFIHNESDIDALLYVHGFDVSLRNTEVRNATSGHLEDVAEMTNKRLIEVETNIRRFLNVAGSWPVITHGPALSAVGHLVSAQYGRLLLPASHTYEDSYAWGSHPLLDHLWSSNRLQVVHDGAGSTRVSKTIALADNSAARKHLRVCWQNTGKYNCGECDKCLRTMIALELTGVLTEFETFESEVPMDTVRKLEISGRSGRSFVLENLEYAREKDATKIADVLQQMVGDFDSGKTRKKKSKSSTPAALKQRLADAEREVERLHNLLPVRVWDRFARWRRRKSKR